jgi:hypothetical protein
MQNKLTDLDIHVMLLGGNASSYDLLVNVSNRYGLSMDPDDASGIQPRAYMLHEGAVPPPTPYSTWKEAAQAALLNKTTVMYLQWQVKGINTCTIDSMAWIRVMREV